MSKPVLDPGDGDGPATQDVAALIGAVVLPFIEPFGPDTPVLAGLPAFTAHPAPVPEPPSRVSVARAVQASTITALAAVKVLEDRTAALKAALVTRHLAAAAVEATAFTLDPWQAGIAETSATAEIATTLCIPAGTATALAHHATELLDHHPGTFDALEAGVLSWRHACTIIDETRTLAETPDMHPGDIAAFEAKLLTAAPGTTGTGFASRARRIREGTHPETLTTRDREAIAKRSMSVEPGKDGMAWLTLHLPAPAANGAFVHCTRLARAQQDPNEHRTLGQIRADTATTLLLGQHLPGTGATAGSNNHESTNNNTESTNSSQPTTETTTSGRTGSQAAGSSPDIHGEGPTARGNATSGTATGGSISGGGGDRGNNSGNATGRSGGNATSGTASSDSDGDGVGNARSGGSGGLTGDNDNSGRDADHGGQPTGGGSFSGARFINDAFSGVTIDVYTLSSRTPLADEDYTGLTLVDVLPDWVFIPRSPAIGPLTEREETALQARETKPENVPHTGALCPELENQPGVGVHRGTEGQGFNSPGDPPDRGDHPAPDGQVHDRQDPGLAALVGELAGALVDGVVDGILEDPVRDYLNQLEATRTGKAITEPPLPAAQVIITVPVLGLLGITNEPATLAGHGPIPEETARKLLNNAETFLRVLVDPVTNTPLKDLPPERYRLREAEKTLLRGLNETCSFPNCTNPVMDTDVDHVTAWAQGGPTSTANTHNLCRRHHALKHFRDDKNKHGHYRQDLEPDRHGIKLRGWKPSTTNDGRIAWTSPNGNYHAPKTTHCPTTRLPQMAQKTPHPTTRPPQQHDSRPGDRRGGGNGARRPGGGHGSIPVRPKPQPARKPHRIQHQAPHQRRPLTTFPVYRNQRVSTGLGRRLPPGWGSAGDCL